MTAFTLVSRCYIMKKMGRHQNPAFRQPRLRRSSTAASLFTACHDKCNVMLQVDDPRSSEYSPRAASSHFLSHESLVPVRLTLPSQRIKPLKTVSLKVLPHFNCPSIQSSIHSSVHPFTYRFSISGRCISKYL